MNNRPRNNPLVVCILAVLAVALVLFDGYLWDIDGKKWQETLSHMIGYAEAAEALEADRADYGDNDYVLAYEQSVEGLHDLYVAYTKDGVALTKKGVKDARGLYEQSRSDYLGEAKRLADEERKAEEAQRQHAEEEKRRQEEEKKAQEEAARKAEEEKKAAEEAKKKEEEERKAAEEAKKEAERKAAEEKAAKEAEEQRQREEKERAAAEAERAREQKLIDARQRAEEAYVEPVAYQMSPSSAQIMAIRKQCTDDISSGCFGRPEYSTYDELVDECCDYLDAYVYNDGKNYVIDGTNYYWETVTYDTVAQSIMNLSQQRRAMFVNEAVDRALRYDVSPQLSKVSESSNPLVYVSALGGNYHYDRNCSGLSGTGDIYEIPRYDAITGGFHGCDICK